MHFSKVKESKACKDKTHTNLNDDEMRDKIMQGTLDREDCDDDNAWKFRRFLKRRASDQIDELKEVNEIKFRKLVQPAKRRSPSSMFSKRDHSVCKCAIKSDRMVKILVKFHNTMKEHNHFLNR